MECVVCNKPAMEEERFGDYADFDCDDCGKYRVTGTVLGILDRAQWLRTTAMQQWIAEQHQAGVERPVINSANAEYEGVLHR
ncbi:TPA: hypothetical protein QEM76_000369 [Pseudomonas putida]|nr:hypothetical protein [Pseudomonas putida]HDS1803709.1 hypothetical protein [Pseudomonas putida]